ncbi:hypothetical protein [Thermoflavimicrobium dichotomicum]|uniref:Uncharacterized protein n=1 Tax=Thermoflavimicrobium dichotomicum TaxID=46223 RepID=A0A1I3UN99_9BACL|nr:hypothetical protein [Thermoflavimicrobium dichotomicum]SFJ84520.1 hypothetical protein SAMN05421852_12624 [Thermoflavimicrobium dichotomicum]
MLNRQDLHHVLDLLLDMREKLKKDTIPDEARHHFKNALKEQLLGVRVCLDSWIEKLDQKEEVPEKQAKKINIEE